jgi:hypothetical protein
MNGDVYLKGLGSRASGCAVDLLESWFAAACVSPQEWLAIDAQENLRGAPPAAERIAARFDTVWTVDGWLLAMSPMRRAWIWRYAEVAGEDCVLVVIDQLGDDPCATGELLWLFRAAGATGCGAAHRS